MGRYRKRKEELQERTENIPPIPVEFSVWVGKELYKNVSHIYYKRSGKSADFHCADCGADYRKLIRRSESLLGQFEQVVQVPKHNIPCRCAVCGAEGVYKASGKIKDSTIYGIRKNCYIGQRYRDGLVVRYFEVEKIFGKQKNKQYFINETARYFFLPGRKVIKDYRLRDFMGNVGWHDHNIGGLRNICLKEGSVYPGSYEALKGTEFEHTGLQEYEQRAGKVKAARYLEIYRRCPHLELLEKTGMYDITDYLMQGNEVQEIIKDETACRSADILAVWPDRVRTLRNEKGNVRMLKVYQMERRKGLHWPEDACRKICELKADLLQLEMVALAYMSIRKFLNRVERYAGVECAGMLCTNGWGRLQSVTGKYLDYLHMRLVRGYDLYNTVIAFPADLDRAHEQMVGEIYAEQINKRLQEANENFSGIQKKYDQLYQYYRYAEGGLFIRPARNGAEIIEEGRTLHHCVGSNKYLQKHNEGRSTILFLRHADDPEEPYITVEMEKSKVIQWYGAYDRKVDQENIETWMEKYIRYLERENGDDGETVIRAAG